MMTLWKIIILFGIKSALILKNNFIANLSIIKDFESQDKILKATDFHDTEIAKGSSNYN